MGNEALNTPKARDRSGLLRLIGVGCAIAAIAVAAFLTRSLPATVNDSSPTPPPEEDTAVSLHVPLPEEVRGIYISSPSAGSAAYGKLIALAVERGLNALVVDVKDHDGAISFVPEDAELAPYVAKTPAYDLDTVVAAAHKAGLYLIARISTFQDTVYAERHPDRALQRAGGSLWRDRRGLAWVDPASIDAWRYNVSLSREAHRRGFDEIQFDYIRFATDGDLKAIRYPVHDRSESFRSVIGRFFAYLDHELRAEGVPISADLFGFTTWHQSDLGIGQWLADGLAHFDHISPMVYPSHYPSGTLSLQNPAAHPYEIVHDSMGKANEVVAELKGGETPAAHVGTLRPWLQAFDLGAVYTTQMVMAQVRAARENGNSGFLFWNAKNTYQTLPYFE